VDCFVKHPKPVVLFVWGIMKFRMDHEGFGLKKAGVSGTFKQLRYPHYFKQEN